MFNLSSHKSRIYIENLKTCGATHSLQNQRKKMRHNSRNVEDTQGVLALLIESVLRKASIV